MKRAIRTMAVGVLGMGIVGVSSAQGDDARRPARLQVPQGAAMTPVALRTSGQAGQVFSVDVYLSNVNDLGGYQIKLKPTGGSQGTLTLQNAVLDKSRKDFVFGKVAIIDAVSQGTGVLLAAKNTPIVPGDTNVGKPRYAGTFNFVASPDAKGVFSIAVEKGPAASMVTNSMAQDIPFQVGKAVTISIGVAPKRPTSTR